MSTTEPIGGLQDGSPPPRAAFCRHLAVCLSFGMTRDEGSLFSAFTQSSSSEQGMKTSKMDQMRSMCHMRQETLPNLSAEPPTREPAPISHSRERWRTDCAGLKQIATEPSSGQCQSHLAETPDQQNLTRSDTIRNRGGSTTRDCPDLGQPATLT